MGLVFFQEISSSNKSFTLKTDKYKESENDNEELYAAFHVQHMEKLKKDVTMTKWLNTTNLSSVFKRK